MNERDTHLKLSETCRAPHLCQLVLMNFAEPQILTTMANLVNLSFIAIPPSAYFHKNFLLQRFIPRLETLGVNLTFTNPAMMLRDKTAAYADRDAGHTLDALETVNPSQRRLGSNTFEPPLAWV